MVNQETQTPPEGGMPSSEDLAWALLSLMDGVKEHEIEEMTGLPEDDCRRIWDIYSSTGRSYLSTRPMIIRKGA